MTQKLTGIAIAAFAVFSSASAMALPPVNQVAPSATVKIVRPQISPVPAPVLRSRLPANAHAQPDVCCTGEADIDCAAPVQGRRGPEN